MRNASYILFAVGAACVFIYMLAALRGASPEYVRAGGYIFYAGVAAILAGALFRWRSRR